MNISRGLVQSQVLMLSIKIDHEVKLDLEPTVLAAVITCFITDLSRLGLLNGHKKRSTIGW